MQLRQTSAVGCPLFAVPKRVMGNAQRFLVWRRLSATRLPSPPAASQSGRQGKACGKNASRLSIGQNPTTCRRNPPSPHPRPERPPRMTSRLLVP